MSGNHGDEENEEKRKNSDTFGENTKMNINQTNWNIL